MYISRLVHYGNRSNRLGNLEEKILIYFVNGSVLSPYRCHQLILEEYKRQGKKISYKVIRDVVLRLEVAGLIKRSSEKLSKHGAIDRIVTTLGIFYIFKNKLYYHGLSIIENNKTDGLYESFLYPYIEQKIVLKIHDNYLMYRIFDYLSRCCNLIAQEFEKYKAIEKEGNISLTLATTETIMTDELRDVYPYGLNGFTDYLSDKFKIKWLKNEKIKTKIKPNTPHEFVISKGRNKISITLHTQKSVASVSHMDLKIGDIQIEKVSIDDTDNEYLFVENKIVKVEDYWNNKSYYIHRELKKLSLELAENILDYGCADFGMTRKELKSKAESLRILKSSVNFMKLIEEMRMKINNQYNYFISFQ